jgi:hypothetical protein
LTSTSLPPPPRPTRTGDAQEASPNSLKARVADELESAPGS